MTTPDDQTRSPRSAYPAWMRRPEDHALRSAWRLLQDARANDPQPRMEITETMTHTTAGDVELTTIDYSTENGPFWYVYVADTPVLPEMPLPLEAALEAFRREEGNAEPGDVVELRPCTDEDLAWAGVKR